jgi:predicted transcriptional regulator
MTTIKVPQSLKDRIALLAKAAGKTTRAWVAEALEREADRAQAREAFVRDAELAAAETDSGGAVYSAKAVTASLRARVAGKGTPTRPKPATREGRRHRLSS